jgi:hypothetical protein
MSQKMSIKVLQVGWLPLFEALVPAVSKNFREFQQAG